MIGRGWWVAVATANAIAGMGSIVVMGYAISSDMPEYTLPLLFVFALSMSCVVIGVAKALLAPETRRMRMGVLGVRRGK